MEEADIKTTTSPQICYHTTLRNVSGQPYIFTAQLIQIKDANTLITLNIHEDAISLFVYRDYLSHVFEMSAFVT